LKGTQSTNDQNLLDAILAVLPCIKNGSNDWERYFEHFENTSPRRLKYFLFDSYWSRKLDAQDFCAIL
jgi:hypothetical protein